MAPAPGDDSQLVEELAILATIDQPTSDMLVEEEPVVMATFVQQLGDRGNETYRKELELGLLESEKETDIEILESERQDNAETNDIEILESSEKRKNNDVDIAAEIGILESEFGITDNKEEVDDKSASLEELAHAKIIFVLGGPGSGKGTQCDKIVQTYGFTHLSTGDLLRDEVASGSERGKQLTAIMERGELVPLDTVLTLLKEAMLKKAKDSKGFLIDGYPRELDQGKKFEADVAAVTNVLYFEVSDATMKERLLHRAKTSGRVDDNEETIVKRLKTFHDHTTPVVDYYGQQNKVCTIKAEGTIDEIFVKVKEYLDKH